MRSAALPGGRETESVKMRNLLEKTRERLRQAGIDDFYHVAQELVCHVFEVDAVEIMTRSYMPDRAKEALLFEYTELCAGGKPLQYVTGRAHFLDIELYVDPRVLIPRPETEGLADIARQFTELRKRSGQETAVLDLCTGSGCIALYLAKHGAKLCASDISKDALELASWNAASLGLELEFLEGDLFEPVENGRKFDIITANPPYIPSSIIPSLDIRVRAWEPLEALDGGEHGWELPDRIVSEYDSYLSEGGLFLMEIGDDQGRHYKELCPNGRIIQDLEGHDRILAVRKI